MPVLLATVLACSLVAAAPSTPSEAVAAVRPGSGQDGLALPDAGGDFVQIDAAGHVALTGLDDARAGGAAPGLIRREMASAENLHTGKLRRKKTTNVDAASFSEQALLPDDVLHAMGWKSSHPALSSQTTQEKGPGYVPDAADAAAAPVGQQAPPDMDAATNGPPPQQPEGDPAASAPSPPPAIAGGSHQQEAASPTPPPTAHVASPTPPPPTQTLSQVPASSPPASAPSPPPLTITPPPETNDDEATVVTHEADQTMPAQLPPAVAPAPIAPMHQPYGEPPSPGENEVDANKVFSSGGASPCHSDASTPAPASSSRCTPTASGIVAARSANGSSTLRHEILKYIDCLGEECEDATFYELSEVLMLGVHTCADLLATQQGDCRYDLSATPIGSGWPENTQIGFLCSSTCHDMCRHHAIEAPESSSPGHHFRAAHSKSGGDNDVESDGMTGGAEGNSGFATRRDEDAHFEWLKGQMDAVKKMDEKANATATPVAPCVACEEAVSSTTATTSQQPRPE